MVNQVANQTENIDIFDPKNITAGTVRQYLDNGNKASDSELAMLVTMAKHQNLNPFLNPLDQRLSAFHSSIYFDLIMRHYIFPAT